MRSECLTLLHSTHIILTFTLSHVTVCNTCERDVGVTWGRDERCLMRLINAVENKRPRFLKKLGKKEEAVAEWVECRPSVWCDVHDVGSHPPQAIWEFTVIAEWPKTK